MNGANGFLFLLRNGVPVMEDDGFGIIMYFKMINNLISDLHLYTYLFLRSDYASNVIHK